MKHAFLALLNLLIMEYNKDLWFIRRTYHSIIYELLYFIKILKSLLLFCWIDNFCFHYKYRYSNGNVTSILPALNSNADTRNITLKHVTIRNSSSLSVGDPVVTIGYSFGRGRDEYFIRMTRE
jgi:hypothetical protein